MFYMVSFPFWLGIWKIPQHSYLCMDFYISMYIFSNKYKLYALLTYKCFVALLFSLWQYFLTRHSTVCLYLIFSPSSVFGKITFPKYLSKYVYICFVYAFSVHQVFCFSLPRHVWNCRTCLLCNKALFSLRLWPHLNLFRNFKIFLF